jgi:hypothetical protein
MAIVLDDITTHPPKGATVRSRKSGKLAKVINRRRDVIDGQPVFLVTVDTGERVAEVPLTAVEYPVIVETPLGAVAFDAGLRVGDRVTNDQSWDGEITKIEPGFQFSEDGLYYWVHWQEREHYQDKLVAKQPVCGHLRQQIWRKL